ncbi:MAG: hypothetical protein PHD82_07470 [Candidatus Riflebacteria bacterium]|nr:hypothetical protein [Candidatus Riflebacteria bacterium]
MNRYKRKLVALMVMFAFFMQTFVPTIVAAQESANQKAQIEQAVGDFQKTYDEIMSIKPIELGKVSEWTLNRINDIKNAWANRPTWLGGKDRSEEEAAALKEKQELERYVPKIKKANEDIKKLQDDAKKTMDLLKSGSFEAAAKTDPSKVYGSIDENASALGIYQKALKDAGQTLLDAANALSTASMVLGSVGLLCTAICAFPPAAPIAGPIAAITGKAATATGIASAILKAAGNTLIKAADKAITDDKQFLGVLGKEVTKAAAQEALNRVVSKGLGNIAGDFADTLVGSADDMILNSAGQLVSNKATNTATKAVIKKVISEGFKPVKSGAIDTTNTIIDSAPLPAANSEPGLNWD